MHSEMFIFDHHAHCQPEEVISAGASAPRNGLIQGAVGTVQVNAGGYTP